MGCDKNPDWLVSICLLISIHAPIVGCDRSCTGYNRWYGYFNPRTHRGVRHSDRMLMQSDDQISIHAPIVGCDQPSRDRCVEPSQFQSTHLSWGATLSKRVSKTKVFTISIHAPIVGCDVVHTIDMILLLLFQSTHPSWGATVMVTIGSVTLTDFNPRTHRGVRQG